LDYSKVAGILRYLNDNALDLADLDFLPSDFFLEFAEGLDLATFVDGGWATLTDEGKLILETVWKIMCAARQIDPEIMYDSPMEFFKSQAEDAEIIPIDSKRKKKK
jgi:hypothetical protein